MRGSRTSTTDKDPVDRPDPNVTNPHNSAQNHGFCALWMARRVHPGFGSRRRLHKMEPNMTTISGSPASFNRRIFSRCAFALVAAVYGTISASAARYPTFDVLVTSKAAYSNVTVTAKADSTIFIRHQRGVANVKV